MNEQKAKSVAEFDPEAFRHTLTQATRSLDIQLSAAALEQAHAYARLLLEWNTRMNLTAITDSADIALRHFADSWSLLPFLDQLEAETGRPLRMIDVGTGAGFPGLPLKIMRPQIELTLLDSLHKRVRFLQTVTDVLCLRAVQCVHGRAEDAGRDPDFRACFDLAVARAVASLPTLCEYCLPFVRTGGCFIAMKAHAEDEVEASGNAIRLLGGKLKGLHSILLPGPQMQRCLVVIEKVRETPAIYPRRAGRPQSEPL